MDNNILFDFDYLFMSFLFFMKVDFFDIDDNLSLMYFLFNFILILILSVGRIFNLSWFDLSLLLSF